MGRKVSCYEYRSLANRCFYQEEDEFIDHLLDRLEARRKYADFLEQEGSVLAKNQRE